MTHTDTETGQLNHFSRKIIRRDYEDGTTHYLSPIPDGPGAVRLPSYSNLSAAVNADISDESGKHGKV